MGGLYMTCDVCGENEAIVHVQQIMGGELYEFHMCGECARKKGVSTDQDGNMQFSLSQLLGGLVEGSGEGEEPALPVTECPKCRTTLKEIREGEIAGCPECYTAFRGQIDELLSEYSDTITHRGKYPEKLRAYKTILVDKEALKKELKEAVNREEYETAARLRDRIREMEEHAGSEKGDHGER
jgi:protein arginine kinase activator